MKYIKHLLFYGLVLYSLNSNGSASSTSLQQPLASTQSLEEQLIKAVESNNPDRVEALLNRGADVDAKSVKTHAKPVFLAAFYGYDTCLEKLLKHNADLTAVLKPLTPQQISRAMKHEGCNKIFLQKQKETENSISTDPTQLQCICVYGSLESIRKLIDSGIDIKCLGNKSQTALHWAAINDDKRVIPFLISQGLSVNARTSIASTPFHYACESGSLASVKVLIENGADITAVANNGLSALHWAATNKDHGETIIPFLK